MNWLKTLILLSVLVIHHLSVAQSGKHFLVESGKIEYRFGGDYRGKEVFYFDQFGIKEYHVKNLMSASGHENFKSRIIINSDKKIEKDLVTGKTVVSTNNSFHNGAFVGETENILKAGHFKKAGSETVAGKQCDKYMGNMGTLCIWKGIVLKSEITVAGKKMIKTALITDTVTSVSQDIFKIKY